MYILGETTTHSDSSDESTHGSTCRCATPVSDMFMPENLEQTQTLQSFFLSPPGTPATSRNSSAAEQSQDEIYNSFSFDESSKEQHQEESLSENYSLPETVQTSDMSSNTDQYAAHSFTKELKKEETQGQLGFIQGRATSGTSSKSRSHQDRREHYETKVTHDDLTSSEMQDMHQHAKAAITNICRRTGGVFPGNNTTPQVFKAETKLALLQLVLKYTAAAKNITAKVDLAMSTSRHGQQVPKIPHMINSLLYNIMEATCEGTALATVQAEKHTKDGCKVFHIVFDETRENSNRDNITANNKYYGLTTFRFSLRAEFIDAQMDTFMELIGNYTEIFRGPLQQRNIWGFTVNATSHKDWTLLHFIIQPNKEYVDKNTAWLLCQIVRFAKNRPGETVAGKIQNQIAPMDSTSTVFTRTVPNPMLQDDQQGAFGHKRKASTEFQSDISPVPHTPANTEYRTGTSPSSSFVQRMPSNILQF